MPAPRQNDPVKFAVPRGLALGLSDAALGLMSCDVAGNFGPDLITLWVCPARKIIGQLGPIVKY